LKKRLNSAVTFILSKYGTDGDVTVFDFIVAQYALLNMQSNEKFNMTPLFKDQLIKMKDPVRFKKGIDLIVEFRESIPAEYRSQTDPYFNGKILGEILKAKKKLGEDNLVDIITEQLPRL
jgi:aminopeptidase N